VTIRFYVLPIERIGNRRGPKYFAWIGNRTGIPDPWNMLDYGLIDRAVLVSDISDANHAALVVNADVYAFPVDVDSNMSQQEQNALGAFLEGFAIPGSWLTGTQTARTVLRTITGMFLFMQRVSALYGDSPLNAGISLNTQWRNVPAALQEAILGAASEWGFTGTLENNLSVRNMLKQFADLWGEKPVHMGAATL
jgi:hypothetical protein